MRFPHTSDKWQVEKSAGQADRWREVEGSLFLVRYPYTLHPTPDTLHTTPYTLHPTPYTLNP